MSRVKFFLTIGVAFSSVCFGATLMQWTVSKPKAEQGDSFLEHVEQPCQQLMDKHHQELARKMIQAIYQEAFTCSFNGEWKQAGEASECAAWLKHGSKKWAFEANDIIK